MRPVSAYITQLSVFLIIAFTGMPVRSQISSSTADFTDFLNYPVFPDTDPLFVFHASEYGSTVRGSLTATPPSGSPGFDFSWSIYDPISNSFAPSFFSESGVPTSTVGDLERGCYRVHITSVDLDTMLRAWVFPNDPLVEVEKGPDGKVMPYRYTCDYLRLIGTVVPDTIPYYDLATGQEFHLPNGMAFEWTSDDPEYEIFGAKLFLNLTIYNQPPYSRPPIKNTRFYLTAVDSFNMNRSDDIFYESVHVKA
ncbi:MAG: hypothetical protein KAT15_05285, partial [Bacteroidales bacterium]|nr:hypothetical protein [Bacteroidales bacterium]